MSTLETIVALLTLLGMPTAALSQSIPGVASVTDGDPIEIHGQRIRLYGIDAPESCQPHDRDRYGRTVAVCFKGDEELNRWMVANGWAAAYRRYSVDYVADEDAARRSRTNIWSGDFDIF